MSLKVVHAAGTEPDRDETDDERLLARVAEGDVAAFERLYRRYYKRVFGFVARIAPRFDIAEDVVEDTMVTVWQKAHTFAGRSKPSTWIFGIAYRKALTASRKEHDQTREGLDATLEADHRQEHGLEAILVREHVARALGQLPPEQRAVVELTYMHGYKYTEIAEIVDCPVGTIKTRMRTARDKLRTMLAGDAPRNKETGDGIE